MQTKRKRGENRKWEIYSPTIKYKGLKTGESVMEEEFKKKVINFKTSVSFMYIFRIFVNIVYFSE